MSNMTVDINALARDIAQLNESIASASSGSRGAPNDLLDRRDQAITDLSKLVAIQTNGQENGAINVSIGKGQRLVIGNSAEQLRMVLPAAQDGPVELYLSVPSGSESEVTSKLTGGELGGALDAGARLINNTRRDVGLLAAGIVATFNAQHASGDDLSGQPGEAFFEPLDVAVTGTRTNSGQSTITATILDVGELTGDGFSVAYEEAGIRLTNLRTGTSELVADGVLDFDGLRLDIQAATPAMTGDVFFIEPSLGAAARMEVAITDGASIAAANRDGAVGDNRNMLSLIALRDSSSLKSGTQSYTSFYGATLSGMAVETRSAISNAETEQSLLRSAEDRLEGLIGVNLDEEATNLIRYQQAYQAAAQVITVANEMFDTLLMASRR